MFFRVHSYSVSTDGLTYLPAEEQKAEGDQQHEPIVQKFSIFPDPELIRFIRLKVTGLLQNPDWHLPAGGECWVFVDEVVVKRKQE